MYVASSLSLMESHISHVNLAESVNAILDALNEATNGNINERKDRLRRGGWASVTLLMIR